ncbi:hypothetical protein [Microbacterium elymi]|uniref:Uncharacterized protein n=1 Tax=Microbacterium elymi TaxID=2909587 RepID=A0ABY5NKX3_9MICO|nr:hypothetical protein [Microbacterium elymi]UUT35838.1 hypothetical protein L2X98_21925 [Microbacterium elymi]
MIWEIDDAARTIEGLDAHGRPMPGYAASLGLLPARPGQRVLATLCEAAIALILLLPLLIVALPVLVGAALDPEPQQVLATRSDLIIVLICAAASWFLSIAFIIVRARRCTAAAG